MCCSSIWKKLSESKGEIDLDAPRRRLKYHVSFEIQAHRKQGGVCECRQCDYIETINFLTRISARYSRLIAEPVAKLAGEVIDHAEKANSIYPSDDQRRQLRKAHLLEARASLMALDVRLTHCYLIMTQNPQGCFTTPSGKSVDAKKATERLDKMAQKLGELIDKENDLLQGMIGTVNKTEA